MFPKMTVFFRPTRKDDRSSSSYHSFFNFLPASEIKFIALSSIALASTLSSVHSGSTAASYYDQPKVSTGNKEPKVKSFNGSKVNSYKGKSDKVNSYIGKSDKGKRCKGQSYISVKGKSENQAPKDRNTCQGNYAVDNAKYCPCKTPFKTINGSGPEVSVCGDATFVLPASVQVADVCSGDGATPSGTVCPRKGDKTTLDCRDTILSYLTGSQKGSSGTCVAP